MKEANRSKGWVWRRKCYGHVWKERKEKKKEKKLVFGWKEIEKEKKTKKI